MDTETAKIAGDEARPDDIASHVINEPPATLDLPLRKPLTNIEGMETLLLSLREPTVDELVTLANHPGGADGIMVINLVTGHQFAPSVGKMPARDYRAAMAYLGQFLTPQKFEGEPPETKEIPLRNAIETSGGAVSALSLREPTARELIAISSLSGTKGDLEALALVTGLDKAALGGIGAWSFMQALAYIQSFFD